MRYILVVFIGSKAILFLTLLSDNRFSGSHAPDDHLIMQDFHEKLFTDGEPNMPFMFSWANEPWSKRWTGEEDKVLLSQNYGDEDEWREHFEYLVRFFEHPNYIKEQGMPVFAIYRTGHVSNKLKPMVALWRKLAAERGLPGLHLISTCGNFYDADVGTDARDKEAGLDAGFHFWPQLMGSPSFKLRWVDLGSERDLKIPLPVQYWGSFTGFDRRPRQNDATAMLRTVEEFSTGIQNSFSAMANFPNREVGLNLYFITAWNEWNEQALLEPDDSYKFGYLESIQTQLRSIPVRKGENRNATNGR
jgi:hypothetical protein